MQEPIPGAPDAGLPPGFGPVGRWLMNASKAFAIAGGLVFVGLVAMSIVSIVGRKLFAAPVPGDVEVLQMCASFAAASFFAYCHLNGGDVKVDFFTQHMAQAKVQTLDTIGSLLVGLFGLLLAWRTAMGALTVKASGETSMLLAWPQWIPQMLIVPGFVLLGLAGLYMAGRHWEARHPRVTTEMSNGIGRVNP